MKFIDFWRAIGQYFEIYKKQRKEKISLSPHFVFSLAYKDALATKSENRVDCSFDNPPPEGKVCNIPVDRYDPCVSGTNYSYPRAKPCVFLKLNKVHTHSQKSAIFCFALFKIYEPKLLDVHVDSLLFFV